MGSCEQGHARDRYKDPVHTRIQTTRRADLAPAQHWLGHSSPTPTMEGLGRSQGRKAEAFSPYFLRGQSVLARVLEKTWWDKSYFLIKGRHVSEWLLNLTEYQNHLNGSFKHRFLGYTTWVSNSVGLRQSQETEFLTNSKKPWCCWSSMRGLIQGISQFRTSAYNFSHLNLTWFITDRWREPRLVRTEGLTQGHTTLT